MQTLPKTVPLPDGVMMLSNGGVTARVIVRQHSTYDDCMFLDVAFGTQSRTFFTLTEEAVENLADRLLDWLDRKGTDNA